MDGDAWLDGSYQREEAGTNTIPNSVHQKEEELLNGEAAGIRTIPVVIAISTTSYPSISYIL